MHRCLQLASLGAGRTAPNPMVGAVLVRGGTVIAEAWHQRFGGPHAEVECLKAFGNAPLPEDATLYVNLEPCAHHGKTPPCAELLVRRGVRRVVIGQLDPFPAVAGKGIALLEAAGVMVTKDVLLDECRWRQRRFLTSVEHGRPYIILKWTRSEDGLLDQRPRTAREVQRISSPATDVLVHRWRSQEQAILVGSRTVVNDDPSLTVRHVAGRQPLRVVLDRNAITPAASKVYTSSAPTLLFTQRPRPELSVEQVILPYPSDPIADLLRELHARSIRSVLVEGGAELHQHFLRSGLWDEVRIIQGRVRLAHGTAAPILHQRPTTGITSDVDDIEFYLNPSAPIMHGLPFDPSWSW